MIRIFKLVVLLVISQVAFGQAPSNYTNINGRYRWIAGMFDSTFHIPKGTTPSLRTGGSTNAGALFYKTGDSSLYIYTGTQWLKQAGTAGFVPYSGATQNVDLGQYGLKTKYVEFDTSSQAVTDRRLQWSNDEGTLQFGMTNGATITQRVGLEQFARVKNVSGSQINKGQAVYIYGASGDRASVKLADNRADSTSSKTLGVAAEDIPINDVGLVGTFGVVSNLNLSAFTAGDILYLDSIPGGLTKTKPQAPYHMVFVGVVERANSGNGLLFVSPQNGYELEELHNVKITSPTNGQVLAYYNNLWVDTTISGAGLAVTSVATNTGTGITGGTITTTGTLAIDTLLISTRAWRQKGVDSLQANINLKLNISDTASMLANYITGPQTFSNYMAKFNGNGTIDTSRIYQNNGLIGINTTGASYSLDVLGTGRFTSNSYFATSSGVVGIGTTSADSLLTVQTGAWIKRGLRLSGLPTGTGTKGLRVDANGVVSLADTLTNGISGTGTTNYIPKFTSSSAIGNSVIYESSSNIGIGTTNPTYKLSVNGGIATTNDVTASTGSLGVLFGTASSALGSSDLGFIVADNNGYGSYNDLIISPRNNGAGNQGNLRIYTSGSERLRISSTGNVSVGNTNNTYKLDVTGTIRAITSGGNAGILLEATSGTETPNVTFLSTTNRYNLDNSSGNLRFFTEDINGNNGVVRMTLDASGNLGLGVTPSAWGSNTKAFQLTKGTSTGAFASLLTSDEIVISRNAYFDNTNWKYIAGSSYATFYQQSSNGSHSWSIAPSGTAGNAISFTQAMTLDASGRLGIGVIPTGSDGLFNVNINGATFHLGYGTNYDNYYTSGSSGFHVFRTGNTERMRITSGGNVGVGTSAPQNDAGYTAVTINGSTGGQLGFFTGGVQKTNIYGDANGLALVTAAATPISFLPNSSEKMRLTSSGELLINTTSDAGDYKLQVNGNLYVNGASSLFNGGALELSGSANAIKTFYINRYGVSTGSQHRLRAENGYFEIASANSEPIKLVGGNVEIVDGSIKTAAPSGGTAAAWKLGERVASAGVTFNDQQYIQLDIGGTLYYLATVDLPMPEAYPQATSGPSNNYKMAPVQVKTTRDAEIEKLRKEIEELKQLIKNK